MKNRFHVHDQVYYASGRGLLGPYLISSVPSPQTYILRINDGIKIEGGRTFSENELHQA
jgi:hypothetical protein